eukprot:TRINITY_DN32467_c0_g1_i1.p1 TRINITY_DN32467_c0_g1~~TRINITY_DN32467_c0_g1_i1.p1  ORF type:complete len:685 (+),score=112.06 TRINITY_DN32467_c0_g1_i1:158-2212(+)
MAPWTLLAGAAATFIFPQHRGVILVVGAVVSAIKGNGNGVSAGDSSSNGEADDGKIKRVILEWKKVNCRISKKGKGEAILLNDVSGCAQPGRLLAIMGPSGSGKTTLLNTLAGQLPCQKGLQLTGEILLNGVAKDKAAFRQAYVRQEDIFYSQLTVRETLVMAAKLQLPAALSDAEKEERADRLIHDLGLDSSANTIVGDAKTRGISGGEKKRLSIACELIASPSLVFADEPTTGLDSFQAEKVMGTLQQLAREGHTVICSIHQARGSIYSMFDDLVLLTRGQVSYTGPAGNTALDHFANLGHKCDVYNNPADFFADLISVDYSSPDAEASSKERVASLVAAFRTQEQQQVQENGGEADHERQEGGTAMGGEEKQMVRPLPGKGLSRKGGPWVQFKLLLQRAWRQTTRDRSTNLVRGAVNMTSALIFGSVFWRMGLAQTAIQDRMGLLQVAAVSTAMSSLTKTLNVFPRERLIVNQERSKGSYEIAPYFFSKLTAELPISSLFPLLFGAVVYPMTGLNRSWNRFARFLGIVTLESITASAMGLFVGCLAPTTEAAMAMGPSIMTLFIVFGGYYINADNTPRVFRWIPNVSLIRWSFEGLAINEFKGLQFEAKSRIDARTGEDALERLSLNKSSVRHAASMETKIMLGWYWLTFYLLKNKKPKFQRMLPPPQAVSPSEVEPIRAE